MLDHACLKPRWISLSLEEEIQVNIYDVKTLILESIFARRLITCQSIINNFSLNDFKSTALLISTHEPKK